MQSYNYDHLAEEIKRTKGTGVHEAVLGLGVMQIQHVLSTAKFGSQETNDLFAAAPKILEAARGE